MNMTSSTRASCRPRMMPVEIGIILRTPEVPVVIASLNDRGFVRSTLETAIQIAQRRDDIAGRQEARLLSGLLDEMR